MLRNAIPKLGGIFVFAAAFAVAGPAWAVVTDISYNEVGQTKDFKLELTHAGELIAEKTDPDGDNTFGNVEVAQQHTETCVESRLINKDGMVISKERCVWISSADGSRVTVNATTGQVVVAGPVTPAGSI